MSTFPLNAHLQTALDAFIRAANNLLSAVQFGGMSAADEVRQTRTMIDALEALEAAQRGLRTVCER